MPFACEFPHEPPRVGWDDLPVAIVLILIVRPDSNPNLIRAVARVGFTDLIDQGARKTVCDLVLGRSIIVRRPDNIAISQYVYGAAVSWTPGKSNEAVTALSANLRVEHDGPTSAAGIKLEGTDTRVPVEAAGYGVVFIRSEEGCTVGRINGGHAIVTPAVRGLASGAVEHYGFTLGKVV